MNLFVKFEVNILPWLAGSLFKCFFGLQTSELSGTELLKILLQSPLKLFLSFSVVEVVPFGSQSPPMDTPGRDW
jgi:hypothetical protein